MIRRRVRAQLVAFLLLSAAGIVYLGTNYVGLDTLFRPPYTVVAELPSSGGIFTNAEVTYRGVNVGRVGALHLTKDGVAVDLRLDDGTRVPADTRAVVRDLSAVGEQYVDLQPRSDGAPYLHDGSTIGQSSTDVPISTNQVLLDLDKLVKSVPRAQLTTLIDALGQAFTGIGPDLQQLIDRGDSLTTTLSDALPQTVRLIDSGKTVLDTQRATADDLAAFSKALAQLSGTVVDIDPSIRATLDNGVLAAGQLTDVLKANQAAIPVLLDNLLTVGQIQLARLPGLNQILMLYPQIVRDGFRVTPGDGTAHFGLIVTSGAGPCTNGYQSTDKRPGTDTSYRPANLGAYCDEPHTSAITPRGARNAPRPIGDDTAGPQGIDPRNAYRPAAGSGAVTRSTSASPAVLSSYDAVTGLVTAPDGTQLMLGSTGGQSAVFGSNDWQWLLLGPLAGAGS